MWRLGYDSGAPTTTASRAPRSGCPEPLQELVVHRRLLVRAEVCSHVVLVRVLRSPPPPPPPPPAARKAERSPPARRSLSEHPARSSRSRYKSFSPAGGGGRPAGGGAWRPGWAGSHIKSAPESFSGSRPQRARRRFTRCAAAATRSTSATFFLKLGGRPTGTPTSSPEPAPSEPPSAPRASPWGRSGSPGGRGSRAGGAVGGNNPRRRVRTRGRTFGDVTERIVTSRPSGKPAATSASSFTSSLRRSLTVFGMVCISSLTSSRVRPPRKGPRKATEAARYSPAAPSDRGLRPRSRPRICPNSHSTTASPRTRRRSSSAAPGPSSARPPPGAPGSGGAPPSPPPSAPGHAATARLRNSGMLVGGRERWRCLIRRRHTVPICSGGACAAAAHSGRLSGTRSRRAAA